LITDVSLDEEVAVGNHPDPIGAGLRIWTLNPEGGFALAALSECSVYNKKSIR